MKSSISGIRGIFGKDFNLKDILQYCNNFTVLIKTKKCVVGRDARESSGMIANIAKVAMMQNGIDVYDLGLVPTPVVFREARRYGAGVMITASHNPTDWNGLKFIINGAGINENQLSIILEKQNASKTRIGYNKKIITTYVKDALNVIGKIDKKPKVVVDLGGGSTIDFAPKLLERLGCRTEIINDTLQRCNRLSDPTIDSLKELVNLSKKNIGFAFDLDGDRLVVVNDGKKQEPDVTLGLGIAKSIKRGCKKFVLSVDTSSAIERFIVERGGIVYRSKVGEANVVKLMQNTNSDAGGEGSSGGFILPEFNYCRDGILTSGLIVSMFESPEFNEIINYMKGYYQIRKKIKVHKNHHTIEKTFEKISKEFSDISNIDGIKCIIDENSWILIRESNTENVIRISGEAKNYDECKKKVDNITRCINEQIK